MDNCCCSIQAQEVWLPWEGGFQLDLLPGGSLVQPCYRTEARGASSPVIRVEWDGSLLPRQRVGLLSARLGPSVRRAPHPTPATVLRQLTSLTGTGAPCPQEAGGQHPLPLGPSPVPYRMGSMPWSLGSSGSPARRAEGRGVDTISQQDWRPPWCHQPCPALPCPALTHFAAQPKN